jgi:sugar phosphate isomerase/epimerase
MLIPGPIHAELGRQRSLDLAADALVGLLETAREHGVRVDVEADCDSCARTPAEAEQLCERVPGLRLALDYSHFIFHGYTHDQIERLDRFAGHVHVRQASPGRIVEHADRGLIDVPRLIASLTRDGYRGLFAVEYLSCREADECGADVAAETRKMVGIMEGLLAEGGNS